jgi:hypothetical protein
LRFSFGAGEVEGWWWQPSPGLSELPHHHLPITSGGLSLVPHPKLGKRICSSASQILDSASSISSWERLENPGSSVDQIGGGLVEWRVRGKDNAIALALNVRQVNRDHHGYLSHSLTAVDGATVRRALNE